MSKVGRNEPCPCGSGKKYKFCCADVAAEQREQPPAGSTRSAGVGRVLDWLLSKHSKAMAAAMNAMFAHLPPEQTVELHRQDRETWTAIQINSSERLLAEGEILVQGRVRRVAEYLLSPSGPLLTVDLRDWIAQLAERPLRLYDVTDVIPGEQLTLCDVLDDEAPPIVVRERAGSVATLVGTRIGARLMTADGHSVLSGALYPFAGQPASRVTSALRDAAHHSPGEAEPQARTLSRIIYEQWLSQLVAPPALPTLIDRCTGESMLLITDHYRVHDWGALVESLAAQADVSGDRDTGWNRLVDGDDGQTRSAASINVGQTSNRLTTFFRTQHYADDGRRWFESIAGDAVQFLTREVSDPTSQLGKPFRGDPASNDDHDSGLSPEQLSTLLASAVDRLYANWADEPIPVLDGQTPRQAIQTPGGLERVKGLLRTYEATEKQSALRQQRPEISYDFLWQALGISR